MPSCIYNVGPGIKPSEERTLEYLEEVAVKIAQDLADKKMKINRTRPLFESMSMRCYCMQELSSDM